MQKDIPFSYHSRWGDGRIVEAIPSKHFLLIIFLFPGIARLRYPSTSSLQKPVNSLWYTQIALMHSLHWIIHVYARGAQYSAAGTDTDDVHKHNMHFWIPRIFISCVWKNVLFRVVASETLTALTTASTCSPFQSNRIWLRALKWGSRVVLYSIVCFVLLYKPQTQLHLHSYILIYDKYFT